MGPAKRCGNDARHLLDLGQLALGLGELGLTTLLRPGEVEDRDEEERVAVCGKKALVSLCASNKKCQGWRDEMPPRSGGKGLLMKRSGLRGRSVSAQIVLDPQMRALR